MNMDTFPFIIADSFKTDLKIQNNPYDYYYFDAAANTNYLLLK